MNKNSDAKIRANNRYTEKTYDRINLAVPKGVKAEVQKAAQLYGMSVNGYVWRVLRASLEKDLGQ